MDEKKIRVTKLTEEELEEISKEEAYERSYYEDSVIIKINKENQLVDDIATCFSIEDTMQYLMLAPLEFIARTEGAPNQKELMEKLWQQVRIFYKEAREILDKRYRL